MSLSSNLRELSSLQSLPVELLHEIQLFALSETLPSTSRQFYQIYKSSSSVYRANYIFLRLSDIQNESELYTRALRYPLCNKEVFQAFRKLALQKKAASQDDGPRPPKPDDQSQQQKVESSSLKITPKYDIPRRLFRNLALSLPSTSWSDSDPPLPFLHHLFEIEGGPQPNVNANSGYALTRAVHAQFIPLVRFLLERGASPAMKDSMAVLVAIRQKNLHLVKMLIERQPQIPEMRSSKKRRKLEDRLKPDVRMLKTAVQCNAKDIAEYLCHEKGVVPDMQTLQMML